MNTNCSNCYFSNHCCYSDELCKDYTPLLDEEITADVMEISRTEYHQNWNAYINEDSAFFNTSC